MNIPVEETLLPLKAPKLILNPTKLKYLMIAPPKWGKTTLFSGCPNACLLAFEAGYSSAECPIIVITAWDRGHRERKEGWKEDETGVVYTSAIEVLEELEKNNPYDFLIIDTIDMATKLCADYHCELARVNHPSEGGDFGRGWDLLQTGPIRKFYNRLVKLGVGVAAITHVKEKVETDKFMQDRFRRETSLPSGVQQFIHAQSDVIMHGFFSRRRKGQRERDRYISFDGTNEVMAGTRIRKVYIPNKFIVDPPTRNDLTLPWKQWANFFVNNPSAGELAEKQFTILFEGRDDESLLEKQETKTEKKDGTTASKEKNQVGQAASHSSSSDRKEKAKANRA
jgi:AAA domain